MANRKCATPGCSLLVRMNAKTYNLAVAPIPPVAGKNGRADRNYWHYFCPTCDAGVRGRARVPIPFLCADGVWRTLQDHDAAATPHDFCGLRFTESARRGAEQLTSIEEASLAADHRTQAVEVLGAKLFEASDPSADDLFGFSEAVCDWGRDGRIWPNLVRHMEGKDNLGAALQAWLESIKRAAPTDVEAALQVGVHDIKGLDVSYASKHLRMLNPARYAVLDSVLCAEFGLALNLKGYALFMRLLRELRERMETDDSVASLEMQIFVLARQQLRTKFSQSIS